MKEWRNPQFNRHGTVDVEIEHPTEGWLPFTASPDDIEEEGRLLFAAIVGAGEIAPYTQPPVAPTPVPSEISRRQFYQGLAVEEKITKAEALAAIKTGDIPAALQVMLDQMTDPEQRFAAEMLLVGAGEFRRDHPLVTVIGSAQSMTEQDVDDFWRLCFAL